MLFLFLYPSSSSSFLSAFCLERLAALIRLHLQHVTSNGQFCKTFFPMWLKVVFPCSSRVKSSTSIPSTAPTTHGKNTVRVHIWDCWLIWSHHELISTRCLPSVSHSSIVHVDQSVTFLPALTAWHAVWRAPRQESERLLSVMPQGPCASFSALCSHFFPPPPFCTSSFHADRRAIKTVTLSYLMLLMLYSVLSEQCGLLEGVVSSIIMSIWYIYST